VSDLDPSYSYKELCKALEQRGFKCTYHVGYVKAAISIYSKDQLEIAYSTKLYPPYRPNDAEYTKLMAQKALRDCEL